MPERPMPGRGCVLCLFQTVSLIPIMLLAQQRKETVLKMSQWEVF